jgi:hypothetical protein
MIINIARGDIKEDRLHARNSVDRKFEKLKNNIKI